MRPSTYRRLRTHITQAIGGVLAEHAAGLRRLSVSEIVALSNIIDAEKPTVFAIQNVLVNELAYLTTYNAPHETRAAITEFLQKFQTEAANDALATEKTVKDGLTLREGLLDESQKTA